MKTINKLVTSAFFLFVVSLINAQTVTNPGGGAGGTGPGAPPASPIDMYVYALSVVAILFIVFFATKIKKQEI